jgi:hypothetical protein
MAEYLLNLTNGEMDEKGFLRLFGTLLNQTGVVQSGALAVSAQGTPDMTVKVAGGTTGHDVVFITSAGDTYHGWNTADKNVTITANATGVEKSDAIVAYADLSAGSATSNNPGALKFVAIRNPINTSIPSASQIEDVIGVGTPYLKLAIVQVANGASSINSGNITDQRVRATLAANTVPTAAIQDSAVSTAKIADNAITTSKINTNAVVQHRLTVSWFSAGTGRSSAVNAMVAIAGQTPAAFTTSGGLLKITVNINGLSLSAGVGYIGYIISGAGSASGEGMGTNFATISQLSMERYITLGAGDYTIAPGYRGNGGTIAWNPFNTAEITIVEYKK